MGSSKGSNLGEFEEIVLLVVGTLTGNAYTVEIRRFIIDEIGRNVNISAIHEVLKRLEKKGFVTSELGGATQERGGRRKKLFQLTTYGKTAIIESRATRNELFARIPNISQA